MFSTQYRAVPINLAADAIRVLCLQKGEFLDQDIQCKLIEVYLAGPESFPYKALSYHWGSDAMSHSISINSCRARVTTNLYMALRYLREEGRDIYLWVDALCIDQANHMEKSHQIRQMQLIYKNAEEVLIWLGLGCPGIYRLIDSSNKLKEQLELNVQNWRSISEPWELETMKRSFRLIRTYSLEMDGLRELLGRPWFRRVWILQEVVSARHATVICGGKSISGTIFAILPFLMDVKCDDYTQAVLDIMPGPARETSWWGDERTLKMLLRKFRTSKATMSQDKIYALLGISSDAGDGITFPIDYELSPEEVIQNAISFLLLGRVIPDSNLMFPQWTFDQLLQSLDQLASNRNYKALSVCLQELEVNPNEVDVNYTTPLKLGVINGHREVARLLARRGAAIEIKRNIPGGQ
ncbi:heterokaryon incompatibility protein-domain-containing protein [Diplogelasinospora grovesii]|uniref:Heterokaryon incompatibility protein-domain-containing protein n=1 Tax=Diplogelasinospora grovesii TaxID=303347 RepID=A0AAN6RYF7_9PEZI|nr:heterokaryon incompatibility protein-domain-containing protein [Diplogelasinospora grovesii]